MKKAVIVGIAGLALAAGAAPASADGCEASPTIHNLCNAITPDLGSASVSVVSMHETEVINGETFTYDGNCVGGPGVQPGGPGTTATYEWTMRGTATSSSAADATISTAGECDVHFLGGGPLKTFGRSLTGPQTAAVDTVAFVPGPRVEACITVGGNFLNGHNGSKTLCQTFG